jgi:hypothetical protein
MGTGLLVDVGGNFLKDKQSALTWSGGEGMADVFAKHYGTNLISIPEFTLEMSDANAATLIASYIAADRQALFGNSCPARAALLPAIKFAAEEANIKITDLKTSTANKQRILACGDGSATDVDKRRLAKYEAAAEGNETGQINRDCSSGGCPGIAYFCDATKCSAVDQLNRGRPATTQPIYTPSYGRSQFIGNTLVGELLAGYTSFSAQELAQLGLTPDMKQLLRDAQARGRAMVDIYRTSQRASSYAEAGQAWNKLSATQKQDFINKTGLGERAYVDMIRIKTQPPRNSNGTDLSGDAVQALATSAIMSNNQVKTFLMGIFQDFDRFTLMSISLMRKNLKGAQRAQPGASEEYLAGLVARAHNGGGGRFNRTLADLMAHDANDYVKNFIGVPEYAGKNYAKKGDWRSLRCTQTFGPNTVKPGSGGKGIGGLEMGPLKLN